VKVLIVTNYYPPADDGWGYMQLCEEVAEGLSSLGHELVVLTSTRKSGKEVRRDYPVFRLLSLDPDWDSDQSATMQFFLGRSERERQTIKDYKQIIDEHQPEIVFVWHAIGLPKTLLMEAESTNKHLVVYYLADYQAEIGDEYIEYWEADPVSPIARIFKSPISKVALSRLAHEGKPVRLKYEHTICVSQYVRDRLVSGGFIPESAVVIHNGVDLSEFTLLGNDGYEASSGRLRCLVAGRIIPNKGVHTVVNAFASLDIESLPCEVSLTILGDGPEDYIERIRSTIRKNNLQDVVRFQSPIPRTQMPDILASHEVLILPSEYDEPLARAIQEAMAMELLVIGTTTGGSGELLVHEQTGLVFTPGDARSLAAQIVRSAQNPDLVTKLRKAGRKEIERHFNIQRTVAQVEDYLLGLMAGEAQGET
jgi:glycogen(starch) synthase